MVRNNKTSRNLGGLGEALSETSIQRTDLSNVTPRKRKIKPFIVIQYVDTYGYEHIRHIEGNRAFMLVYIWNRRVEGLTQKEVLSGFTLKDYIYLFGSCFKSGFYMNIPREDEPNRDGSHRRYWLKTDITFLDEYGFPTLRTRIQG